MRRRSTEWPPYPPPNETPEEQAIRSKEEEAAKRISKAIDESIEKEKRKDGPQAKLLLLGQAESGKSTVLKNFQLHFAPQAFHQEARYWRPVIHLNLLRSILFILDLLDKPEHSNSPQLRKLQLTLGPLKEVEESLLRRVRSNSDVGVRKRWRWMKSNNEEARGYPQEDDNNRRVLMGCADAMVALWEDKEVRRILDSQEIMIQDQSGFFLDSIRRITRTDYVPTSDDILRARVQTTGPEEHRIPIEHVGADHGKEWVIYDVGGTRTQRAAWAQFFDDVTAIIFLAPVSAFNQTLAEDSSVNRLADSMKLWRQICSNKILADVKLVLFLNKIDLLAMQLKKGVRFNKYVTSYKDDMAGSRNNVTDVVEYLTDVFQKLHREYTPKKRKVHVHWTCATDMRATSQVITRIQEVILVRTLEESSIL